MPSHSKHASEYLRGSLNELLELEIEIEIEQFKGEWFDLDTDSLCQFPSAKHPNGVNNALGSSSVLGRRCYQVQNRFTIVIVPKTEEEFERCAPGSATLEKLKRFV